jgi:hypothetical protein
MTDPCLSSNHLDFQARREHFRHTRAALLGAQSGLTLGWGALPPVRPHRALTGAAYHLVDQRTGRTYPLRVGLNTIGRLPDNDIVFDEFVVSRRHCVILVHARGGCELHDTASLNGTFLNGQRIQRPMRLTSGDCIQVFDRPLLFESEADEPAAPEGAVLGTRPPD